MMTSTKNSKTRLLSLDALRGFDMIWILGAEGIFHAMFVLTGWSVWQIFERQFEHSQWHGMTFYDLIFPLFIFLSGVTLGIANKKLTGLPLSERMPTYKKAAFRLLLLCLLGVIYNHGWGQGIPAAPEKIRYASVLMRIAIAWFLCAIIVWHVSIKGQLLWAIGILIGYWVLLKFIPVPNGLTGELTVSGSWNSWFDQHFLPGISYRNLATDPEGILSHIPAVVNALAGVFTGRLLCKVNLPPFNKVKYLILASLICLLLGYLWGEFFPINKTLWTSSFVLVTVGWSGMLMALFYSLIDQFNWHYFGLFFAVIGCNSLLFYLASSIVNWPFTVASFSGGIISSLPPFLQPILAVSGLIAIQWLVAYFLFQRKIFIKI